jgi:putative transcriptional regulator
MGVENMSKKYSSPAMAAVHEMISDLHEAGVIDKVTMRHFDEQCLTPIQEMTPSGIVNLRKRERASQAVFARYLNIPPSLVSQWERGEKRPNGPSLKLLCLVKAKGLSSIM